MNLGEAQTPTARNSNVKMGNCTIVASATTLCPDSAATLTVNSNYKVASIESELYSGLGVFTIKSTNSVSGDSWTYGLPGVMVFGDSTKKYGSIESSVRLTGGFNAGISAGLVMSAGRNSYNDGYAFNGPGCFCLSIGEASVSLLNGINNSPSGYGAEVLASVSKPDLRPAEWNKLRLEIRSNEKIFCYIEYSIPDSNKVLYEGRFGLVVANTNYDFENISVYYAPSIDWSNGKKGSPIVVSPTDTTRYKVTVSLDSDICMDSITINVEQPRKSFTEVKACQNYLWNGTLYTKAGTYYYRTSASKGCDSIAVLNLSVGGVAILEQPKDQVARVGESAVFKVLSADSITTFQWQTNTGQGFMDLTDSSQYFGSNTHSLAIGQVSNKNYGQAFRCVLQSTNCMDTSNVVYLYTCDSSRLLIKDANVNLNMDALIQMTPHDSNKKYIWHSNPANYGWSTIPKNLYYEVGPTDQLLVKRVQASNHKQPFKVTSSDQYCNDTSNIAYIYIADTCFNSIKIFDTITTKIIFYDTITTIITKFDTIITKLTVFDTLITKVTVFDTIRTLISVTDTLLIKIKTNSINPLEKENLVKIFPNPTNDFVTIDYGKFALLKDYSIRIVDSGGKVIFFSAILQQTSTIDLNSFGGKGLYFVQVFDPQNVLVDAKKIVLQ